jgi:anion transporter
MTGIGVESFTLLMHSIWRALLVVSLSRTLLGMVLGPTIGMLVWCLHLGLAPTAHKALAVTAFMVVYWITEPLEHGITALIGCYLFWALGLVNFSVAFSGFASSPPWFIFGVLLMGQAASSSGLTKRIGFIVMRRVGVAPTRLLFGVIVLVWVLSFFIPSPNALLATLAPLVIGIIATLGVGPQSNLAKGLFVSLTYMSNHVGKLLLGAGGTAMAYGLIEARTGIHVWWSQWLVAFLPASVLTVVACYLTVRWLYPCETLLLSGGQQSLQEVFPELGPWTRDEKKALGWMLLAIALWGTDFMHHIDPAVIALGVGLCLTLPHIGLLDAQALKQMNFLLIFFIAGAMSMGTVLIKPKPSTS